MDSRVRTVRVFLRKRPAQSSGRYLTRGRAPRSWMPLSRCTRRRAYSAAFGSWVTITTVLPCSRLSIWSRRRISSAVARSRSPVGSSQTRSVGSDTMARAMATRCSWPPDSSLGLWRARSASPTSVARCAARRRRSRRGQVGQQQRQLHVPLGREHRQQVVELEDEAHVGGAPARPARRSRADRCAGRPTVMLPPVGVSSPPIRLSRVVLPEPDGPIRATKSPLRDVEVDAVQHLDALAAAPVGLGDAADLDQRVSIGAHRRLGRLHRPGRRRAAARRRQHHALAVAQAAQDAGAGPTRPARASRCGARPCRRRRRRPPPRRPRCAPPRRAPARRARAAAAPARRPAVEEADAHAHVGHDARVLRA